MPHFAKRLSSITVPFVLIGVLQLSGCVPGRGQSSVPGGVYFSTSAGANFSQVTKRTDDPGETIAGFPLQRTHRPAHSPNTVLIGAATRGIIMSETGGESWRVIPTSLAVTVDVVVLPNGTLVASGSGEEGQGFIIRSLDAGKSWETVLTVPVPVKPGRFQLLREPQVASIFLSIEPDPFNPDRIYAGSTLGTIFAGDQSAKVWHTVTTIRGNPLTQANDQQAGLILDIIASPHTKDEIVMITAAGTLIRVNGAKESEIEIPKTIGGNSIFGGVSGSRRIFDVAFIRQFPAALLVATENGAVVSRDNGKTWQELSVPADTAQKFNTSVVTASPSNPNRLFVAINDVVYRSEDGGQSWNTFDFKLDSFGITSLSIDPQNASRVIAVVEPIRS